MLLNELSSIINSNYDVIIADLKNIDISDENEYFNQIKRVLKDDGFIVLFGHGSSFYRWNTILDNLGFKFKEEIVWSKRACTKIPQSIIRIHESVSIHTKGNGIIKKVKVPYTKMKQYNLISILQDINRIKGATNNINELESLKNYIDSGNLNRNQERANGFNVTTGNANKSDYAGTNCLKSISIGLNEKTIIEIKNKNLEFGKPNELIERLLNLVSNENDSILKIGC